MTDNTRAARLEKLFAKILGGSVPVPANQKDLFIDAICEQDDKVSCISRLVASNNGIPSIHAALRYDCSDSFINNQAANLLKYFMAPEIEGASGGSYLEKILVGIVIPPIFWEALCAAFNRKLLGAEADFDDAVFSYEPILKAIQCTKRLPLTQELLFWAALLPAPKDVPSRIITALRLNPCQDLRSLIGTQKSIKLDKPQGESFLNALTQRVSLIHWQGPPGVLIAKSKVRVKEYSARSDDAVGEESNWV